MLPVLMFELAWKKIWLLAFGLAQWSSGVRPPTFGEDFKAIAAGVILMPLVIPWDFVWRHYVTKPGDAWRWSAATREGRGAPRGGTRPRSTA